MIEFLLHKKYILHYDFSKSFMKSKTKRLVLAFLKSKTILQVLVETVETVLVVRLTIQPTT